MSVITNQSRLLDPSGFFKGKPELAKKLNEKLIRCFTKLFCKPESGGNPFIFCYAFGKEHIIDPKLKTAATNGKQYFWGPDFLELLTDDEVPTVMSHECYHTICFHPQRMIGKHHKVANISMDYVANGLIETEHETSGRDRKGVKLWGGNLGNPLTLAAFISYIGGETELPEGTSIFVDKETRSRSPESIYEEIIRAWEKSPRQCKVKDGGCGSLSMDPKTGLPKNPGPYEPGTCPKCGVRPEQGAGGGIGGGIGGGGGAGDSDDGWPKSLDSHMPSVVSRQEVAVDALRAHKQASTMTNTGRGLTPGCIESILNELKTPKLRPSDIIRNGRMRYAADQGDLNDYKRVRRRGLGYETPIYQFRTKEIVSEWVAMIDTSGSMSDPDIANGVKELKLVGGIGRGWIVPCDTNPHWEDKIEVNAEADIQRVKIVGRGGTVFDDFFAGLPKHFPEGFDTVVVITDGDCGNIPIKLKPQGADVVWIITNRREFKPTFGRVVHLDPARF